jgi:hypothetical protein
MRRAFRWTFNGLTAQSLLLCLTTIVLWVRDRPLLSDWVGHFSNDTEIKSDEGTTLRRWSIAVSSCRQVVTFEHEVLERSPESAVSQESHSGIVVFRARRYLLAPGALAFLSVSMREHYWAGFGFVNERNFGTIGDEQIVHHRAVSIPLWFLTVLFISLPLWKACQFVVTMGRHKTGRSSPNSSVNPRSAGLTVFTRQTGHAPSCPSPDALGCTLPVAPSPSP